MLIFRVFWNVLYRGTKILITKDGLIDAAFPNGKRHAFDYRLFPIHRAKARNAADSGTLPTGTAAERLESHSLYSLTFPVVTISIYSLRFPSCESSDSKLQTFPARTQPGKNGAPGQEQRNFPSPFR